MEGKKIDLWDASEEKTVKILKGNYAFKLHEAVISTDMLLELGILNGTWLHVSPLSRRNFDAELPKQGQLCPCVILNFVSYEDDPLNECDVIDEKYVAFISEETAFNIFFEDLESFDCFQKGEQVEVSLRQTGYVFLEPPVASKVKIAIIRSPIFVNFENNYDMHLKNHFKERKHLVKNQVFGVCCEPEKDPGQRACFLWFKVLELEDDNKMVDAAWVLDGISTLTVDGSQNSFVPFDVSCSDNFHLFSKVLNAAFKDQKIEFSNLIKPVLNDRIPCNDVPILLHGPPASGKRSMAELLAASFHIHFYEVNCYTLVGESLAAMEQRIQGIFKKAAYFSPCLLLLRNINAFCNGDEHRLIHCISSCLKGLSSDVKMILVSTSNCYDQLSSTVTRLFTYDIQLKAFDEEIRCKVIQALLQGNNDLECSIETICKKTAGMVLGDFCTLVNEAMNDAIRCDDIVYLQDKCQLRQQNFDEALDMIRAEYKESLGAPDIPLVYWNDVGGLADVKEEILSTIKLPLQYPELMSKGLRRSGLLLYGPPGCGKTLLAKAVATEFSLNFFSVKGPELINMYVGQSEQNVRDMFEKARESSPCIIFFDELDSIAPNRGKSGDSGGVMDRIVSQLLAELDGLQTSNDLFVIGATNRPDLLDNSLLRPGRFDKMVYVGFPETKQDRLNIIRSYTDKMKLSPDVDLDHIENLLPLYLTGADFYALCSDAVLSGIKRCINGAPQNNDEEKNDGIVIKSCDFEIAVKELVPSVSTDDVLKYKKIKRNLEHATTKKS